MKQKCLSIFVDESGNLQGLESTSRYYIISILLHDQSFCVNDLARRLDADLDKIGIKSAFFHSGPIIRGNEDFKLMNWDLRRKIFYRMMGFVRQAEFKYHCLVVDKRFVNGPEQILKHLDEQLTDFTDAHHDIFFSFPNIKVYYDCGQKQLTNFLIDFFNKKEPGLNVEFAQAVEPRKYKLLQVADLACTFKLLELEVEEKKALPNWAYRFFGGEKPFKHNFLRRFKTKEI